MNFDFKKIDSLLTDMKDYHLPFAGFVFVIGSVLQRFHHLDATFVAFSTTVLSFLGGHAWIQGKNDQGNTPQ